MSSDLVKKEIRLKVENKFFNLLEGNANQYGVKTSDYIIHLILDDIKSNRPALLSEKTESNLMEAYQEVSLAKKNGTFKGKTAKQIMQEIQ